MIRAAEFAAAKAEYERLDGESRRTSAQLAAVPGVGSGAFGLTPDAVKFGPEYRAARLAYDAAAGRLRRFAQWYCKEFAVELRQERRERRPVVGSQSLNRGVGR